MGRLKYDAEIWDYSTSMLMIKNNNDSQVGGDLFTNIKSKLFKPPEFKKIIHQFSL